MVLHIPLFPLQIVPLPKGILALRIFETRYLDMVKSCLRTEQDFGIVLIDEGEEVGAAPKIFSVGSIVKIIDWNQQPDGLLGIIVEAQQKIRVIDSNIQANQLVMADVELLPPETSCSIPQEYQPLVDLLLQVLNQLSHHYQEILDSDAVWVGYRLTEFLSLPTFLRQRLIEMDDPLLRLAMLQQTLLSENNS